MKILMLTEYFTPFDFGGSEWSTYYLAKGLAKKKFKVIVLTPNYGGVSSFQQLYDFEVVRFPFYKKIKKRKQILPFWHSNTLWVVWTSFIVLKYCLQNNVDIIHVSGKYFLPAAIFTKIILQKKVVVTLRDYVILCPLGMCLLKDRKVCGLLQYFTHDLPTFLNIYQQDKNILLKLLIVLSTIRARVVSYSLKFLLTFADYKVALSKIEKNIYVQAGTKGIQVIANPVGFEIGVTFEKKLQIVYAGRLTPGKGVNPLIEAIPSVLKKFPKLSFVFYGEGFLKPHLTRRVLELKIANNVKFAGHISHERLLKEINNSQIAVIPSVWPEPFGRIVIESLVVGTPVVVSSHTGVSEQIKDRLWGKIVNPNAQDLAGGINWTMANVEKLQKNLTDDKKEIKERFSDKIYDSYTKIYRSLNQ